MPKLFDRIGVDINQKLPLEAAVDWTVKHKVPFIDLCLDQTPELLRAPTPPADRRAPQLEKAGAKLGLHTLSAVNIAETSPFVAKAADEYLAAYIERRRSASAPAGSWSTAATISARTSRRAWTRRSRASRARPRWRKRRRPACCSRTSTRSRSAPRCITSHDLEECRYYFDRLDSPALGWSFTVNHAHIQPNSIDAFMEGLDMKRCGEVRLADCRGTHEEHLKPGEGTIDFPAMFAAIEKSGYRGHYMQAFGSLDDMLKGRETLAGLAEQGR